MTRRHKSSNKWTLLIPIGMACLLGFACVTTRDPSRLAPKLKYQADQEIKALPAEAGKGLTFQEITEVINSGRAGIYSCYTKILTSSPHAAGIITVTFKIDGKIGRTKQLTFREDTINSPILRECIRQKIDSWIYPLPRGEVDVNVKLPLDFDPQFSQVE